MSQPESDALLAFLFQHIETPKLSCRFRWEKNSIAFGYWPEKQIEAQRKLNLRAAIERAGKLSLDRRGLRQVGLGEGFWFGDVEALGVVDSVPA